MQNFDEAREGRHEPKSEPIAAAPSPKAPPNGGDHTTAANAK